MTAPLGRKSRALREAIPNAHGERRSASGSYRLWFNDLTRLAPPGTCPALQRGGAGQAGPEPERDMQLKTAAKRSADALPAKVPGRSGACRRRWVRVKIDTDEGTYVGSVHLDGRAAGLRELVEADRSYLAPWRATHESSGTVQEFMAIHKSAIRLVVLLGASSPLGAAGEKE